MKKLLFTCLFLASAMIFASCEKDVIVGPTIVITGQGGEKVQTYVPQNDKGEFAITFGGYNSATKASASSVLGNGYDEFTLYSWNSEGETVMNPFNVKANANGYYYEGVNNQQLQYFKNSSSDYSFIGVIPSSKGTSISNGTVTVSGVKSALYDDNRVSGTISADSDEEFLYAYANVVKANYGSVVTLPFEHGNALVYLGFKTTSGKPVELLDYTPYNPGTPGTAAVPGTVSTETISTKALDALRDGYIVGWPYTTNVQPSTSNGNPRFTINAYGGMTDEIAEKVNSQFVYYTDAEGTTVKNDIFTATDVSIKNKVYIKLADNVNGQDLIDGNDAFWNNASETLKTDSRIKKCYDDGWRVVKIDKSFGQWTLWFLSNIPQDISVTTITGGSPAVPAIPESGHPGIRVFSSNLDNEHYVHADYTAKADANISSNGLLWDNREYLQSVLEFKLPSTTSLNAEPVYSPTTFYAIPGDSYKNFVAKISYRFDGEEVYDVRIPINLPSGGFEAGKYYTYIINIDKKGNGSNSSDAELAVDEIDNNNHPVQVKINVSGYGEGETNVVTIP